MPNTKAHNLGLALAVIAVAQLMVVLDMAIVNIALPTIQRALHFSPTGLQWVVNAYTLAFGGLLLLGGRAGDLFGRRRVFITGVVLFTLGSLAGGFATSAGWLIAARVAQGVGGAIVAPTALALVAVTFPEGQARNRAFGVYSAVSAGGGALGVLLGGLIVNYVSWRWVLFVNVPIGIALAAVAPRVLVPTEGRPGRLDLPGALAVTAGMSLLVYGLNKAATDGWTASASLSPIGAGLAFLVAFIVIELRSAQPLMPLRIFASRNRSGAYLVRFALAAGLSGVLFFLTQFMQNILGYSPLQAGLAFLPITFCVAAGAQLATRLIGRIGARTPMTVGALVGAIGFLGLSRITEHSSYLGGVLPSMIALAFGLGMIFVTTTVVGVSGISANESGLSSALLNVGQMLGGSTGLAVLGTVAETVTKHDLLNTIPTRLVISHAITAGYATAFEVACVVALGAVVIAVASGTARRRAITMEPVPEAA
ncbi:MAG TPA: MFS transporter [Candidatus Dormibacteraeota bacterium]|nr:MFS transporter [Candidatus Dormibacteraeota bacterium]